MRYIKTLCLLILLAGCAHRSPSEDSVHLSSIQIIDRNGFSETISAKERLPGYENIDFSSPQPYQKVLRVYSTKKQRGGSSKVTTYHANGHLHQYLECEGGRAHGWYREWYPNGGLKIEAYVIEGTADVHTLAMASWVFEGRSQVWYENGALEAEIYYEKGSLQGDSLYYHPNQTLWKTIPYDHNEIHGIVTAFDDRGNLVEKTSYEKGNLHGKAFKYWENEIFCSVEDYAQGLLQQGIYTTLSGEELSRIEEGNGKQILFQNGVPHMKITYQNGIPEGLVETFREDGTIYSSYLIKDGKKNGEEWVYYLSETPRPKLLLSWEDDILHGMVKTWYPDGKIESQKEMQGNKKKGLSFAWFKDGSLMYAEEYDSDLLVKGSYFRKGDKVPVSKVDTGQGTATLHDANGFFLKKISYEKGKPLLP